VANVSLPPVSWRHGLLPGTTTDILSWMNRAAAGETHMALRRRGYDGESSLTRSPLTALNRRPPQKQRARLSASLTEQGFGRGLK
jgi:hypothetical protein